MPELGAAVEHFLVTIGNRNTAKAYAIALRALTTEPGVGVPLTGFGGETGADRLAAWFTGCWGSAAAATYNARLDALGSAAAWWRDPDWLTGGRRHRLADAHRPAAAPASWVSAASWL
ncbi:hypothetical protein Nocox_13875 [Nonomuraea coxensis DSM 45129]|uniref:Uncharacterized protein n=1 Tax=Nonomuraea coxensis DSM 45129 TaxID=1122611 RepID=A0ABX8TYR5_9ACTN|nr:hypothetical protein [Nonomuraea coxensis]QYC40391.1 hypothetical protein Nocox_13875 [Nonomuraea coxensis DSM 45129]